MFHASRQRPRCHKRDAHKNVHWSELRPLLTWLANRRFQESDALQPDWRLVLVHLGYFPKLPKITFKILRRVYCEAINLIVSALIRKASAPMPRWRLSWLKLLMVTTMRKSSRFLKHHTTKMLIACERQTFLLAHRRRRSSSRHVLQRRWARRNVCRSQAKMLIHGCYLGN